MWCYDNILKSDNQLHFIFKNRKIIPKSEPGPIMLFGAPMSDGAGRRAGPAAFGPPADAYKQYDDTVI